MRYEQAEQQAIAREGIREISDEAARTLAAGWQSPGTVGWTLAAVASGAWTAPMDSAHTELFHDDLFATFRDSLSGSPDHTVWGMLATWAMNGGDNE